MNDLFGVCGADPGTTAQSVFTSLRRRAPDWTNQGVKLSQAHRWLFTTFDLDQKFGARSVVGWGRSGSGMEAFIWDQANGMRELDDVLTALGLDLTGWTLTVARGVSFDGSTIVGYGINPDGNQEAWMATIPSVAPVPALNPYGLAAMVLVLAFATFLMMRKRRLAEPP